jgi:hypothetical protein
VFPQESQRARGPYHRVTNCGHVEVRKDVTNFPKVHLAQYFHFLAIRTDLNSSGIHESVQVQTVQEHSGPEFQDSCHQLFTGTVEKAVSFQVETIVQSRTSRHQERVTESKTAEFCLAIISSWPVSRAQAPRCCRTWSQLNCLAAAFIAC